jgi:hypothetical protein
VSKHPSSTRPSSTILSAVALMLVSVSVPIRSYLQASTRGGQERGEINGMRRRRGSGPGVVSHLRGPRQAIVEGKRRGESEGEQQERGGDDGLLHRAGGGGCS